MATTTFDQETLERLAAAGLDPVRLPARVLREVDESIRLSQHNSGMVLCLAINYGGRAEVVDTVRAIAEEARKGALDPDSIDETTISDALYTAGMPDPDLLIRTAGE